MKKYIAALVVVSTTIFSSIAQIDFRTGSPEFEKELNTLNKEAKGDLTSFKRTLEEQHHVGIQQIDNILSKVTEPVEALLALRIHSITEAPIDRVMQSYSANKNKGWGKIAQDLGIKPGSPEFHALKNGSKGSNKGKNTSTQGNSNSKGNSGSKGNANNKSKK